MQDMLSTTTSRVVHLVGMLFLLVSSSSYLQATEDAKQFYLLGTNASGAGIMPPPGTTLNSYDYYYRGDASGRAASGILLNEAGARLDLEAKVDVDVETFLKVPSALWVAPRKVLGAGVGVGLIVPVGWLDISADADVVGTLTLPDGRTFTGGQSFSVNDDTFDFGDPVLMAFFGWNRGNWHWKVTGLLNVPIAAYDADDISNIAFNRWVFDASGAVTWLDPTKGLEVSAVGGFTFNGENPDTDYKTGTEFHVEYALMKHFSKQFAAGLVGFHFQQITGDSGAGATNGPFKGRVTAIGPSLNYNTEIRSTPVAMSLRWYHDFNVKNRAEGDLVLFQATVPLGVSQR